MGCSLSVLREGWEVRYYYSGRGERRTITTQGRVGGGCNSKRYWLMELFLDHTNYFNRLFGLIFFMPKWAAAFLPFCLKMQLESRSRNVLTQGTGSRFISTHAVITQRSIRGSLIG